MSQNDEKPENLVRQRFKIGLLGASFETQNFGVAALLCGAVSAIHESHPGSKIFIIDYAKEMKTYRVACCGGSVAVELVNIRFSKRFYLANNIASLIAKAVVIRLFALCGLKSGFLSRNTVLKTIQEADVIGSISGGDSFSDIYGIGRLIYVALPQILVRVLNKKLILLPQTIGPFKGRFAKAVARYILRHADKIYSRDHEGLDKAREIVPEAQNKIRFCYDVGFLMQPIISEARMPGWLSEIEPSTPLIGLNVSGLLYIGGYNSRNMFGLKVDYVNLIQDLIAHFVRRHNVQVMLVPHVYGEDQTSESDVVACQKVYEEADTDIRTCLQLLPNDYDQNEIKALIGRTHFFIGSRMHACIGALSQCIPAVGLSYSRKFLGVFEALGIGDLVIDLRSQKFRPIIEITDMLYKDRDKYCRILDNKVTQIKDTIVNVFRSSLN